MKNYIALTFMLLSLSAFASKDGGKVGEIAQDGSASNECERPSVKGCGPCYKACLMQNNSEGIKAADGGKAKTNGSSRTGVQSR
jgi:hypothetical protein